MQHNLAIAFGEISRALDQVPENRECLFLAKLLLTLCRNVDIEEIKEGIAIALRDIEEPSQLEL